MNDGTCQSKDRWEEAEQSRTELRYKRRVSQVDSLRAVCLIRGSLYTKGTWSVRMVRAYSRAGWMPVRGFRSRHLNIQANGVSRAVGICGALVRSSSDLRANESSCISFPQWEADLE